jgi:hypothetical protein
VASLQLRCGGIVASLQLRCGFFVLQTLWYNFVCSGIRALLRSSVHVQHPMKALYILCILWFKSVEVWVNYVRRGRW